MGLYNKKGLYAGYKKNHKEREALDYYATPPQEVTNILEVIKADLDGRTVLEPCAGGGHMVKGIIDYVMNNMSTPEKPVNMIATDIKERDGVWDSMGIDWTKETRQWPRIYDFLDDDYPYPEADYVIMNPPFTTIEPFVIRGLEIAKEKLIVFGRIQFLEGQSRYENILKDNPPTDVYVYVDRIKCGKNGDFKNTEAIQAYAWYVWDKQSDSVDTKVHWIRRK